MANYRDIFESMRAGGGENAAARGARTAPVLHADASKGRKKGSRKGKRSKNLTGGKKSASLKVQRARAGMPKRQRPKRNRMATAKQKAAARRNIKKAQAALRAKKRGHGHKKGKAKRSRGRKMSPKQLAAAKRNLKKARSARRRRTAGLAKSKRVSVGTRRLARKLAKKGVKKVRYTRVSSKPKRKRKKARKSAKRASSRKRSHGGKKGRKRSSSRRRKGGHKKAHHGRRKHRRTRSRITVYGYTASRKTGRRVRSKNTKVALVVKKGAMENPLSGGELAVGMVAGLVGFLGSDFLDRFLASRNVASAQQAVAQQQVPLSIPRALAAIGVAGIPLVAAHYVRGPKTRAALQFFGFAAALSFVSKLATLGAARLLKDTQIGQRMLPAVNASYDYVQQTGMAGLPTGAGACCNDGLIQAGATPNLPSVQQTPMAPPAVAQPGFPPAVERNPLPMIPPSVPIPQPPAARTPNTNQLPSPVAPPAVMQPPVARTPAGNVVTVAGVPHGVGAAEIAEAQYAISQNSVALQRAAAGVASPAERAQAEAVLSQHGPAIRAMQAGVGGLPVSRPASPRMNFNWGAPEE